MNDASKSDDIIEKIRNQISYNIHINRNNFRMVSRLRRGKLIDILGNKYLNVLIVGNGPSILKKEYGKDIDKFDIVIRLNDYKIKGYENNVGEKTDLWFTGLGWQLDKRYVNEKTLICSHKFYKRKDVLNQVKKKMIFSKNEQEEKNQKKRIYYVNNPHMFKYQKFLSDRKYMFSTGMCAILTCINYFYNPVTIVGFDGGIENRKGGTGKVMPHYYERKTEVGKGVHNFKKEQEVIKDLIEEGKLRTLQ